MELTLKERLLLLNVLPVEGDITTLKIIRKLREDLSPSEDEYKEFEIKQAGPNMGTWNLEKDKAVEIPIGEKAMDVVIGSLKRASNEGRLTVHMVELYDKFVTS